MTSNTQKAFHEGYESDEDNKVRAIIIIRAANEMGTQSVRSSEEKG